MVSATSAKYVSSCTVLRPAISLNLIFIHGGERNLGEKGKKDQYKEREKKLKEIFRIKQKSKI